ncbi:hypothetical protein BU25DRAFT_259138 [Macroventuria anomochaeta]|uniref:Uncharacterized protein n=1 Tax=Macroventuria anomochaeta TaxID=301207 RepID=A0ACB6SBM6_9PLEO|nr:uncharacterized protein BU25DRAFT_259138 [Macroventuria anomochaeta]KAF2630502.1 hypothetical protein BU25DRAFT_259138 [Macroventuria anomochaeta]
MFEIPRTLQPHTSTPSCLTPLSYPVRLLTACRLLLSLNDHHADVHNRPASSLRYCLTRISHVVAYVAPASDSITLLLRSHNPTLACLIVHCDNFDDLARNDRSQRASTLVSVAQRPKMFSIGQQLEDNIPDDVQLGLRTMLACAGGGFSLSRLAVHYLFHHNELTLVG